MVPHRSKLFQPRYLKWDNLDNIKTPYYVSRNEFFGNCCHFNSTVVLLFCTTTMLLESCEPHLQYPLIHSHKSMGKFRKLAGKKSMGVMWPWLTEGQRQGIWTCILCLNEEIYLKGWPTGRRLFNNL